MDIYFKLACFYQAKTELYDRTLTDLRGRFDSTSAFIIGDNRKYSNAYALRLYNYVIYFAERVLKIPRNVFVPNFRKYLNNPLSAQEWIDTYNYLVENGEMDFINGE